MKRKMVLITKGGVKTTLCDKHGCECQEKRHGTNKEKSKLS